MSAAATPKLVSDDGRNVVIRPLAYVAETELERWAAHRAFPIIPCTLCGSQVVSQFEFRLTTPMHMSQLCTGSSALMTRPQHRRGMRRDGHSLNWT